MNIYESLVRLNILDDVKIIIGSKYVSIDKIKKLSKDAYKKLSMSYHPDTGGDIKLFLQIQEAYNNIKNITKNDIDNIHIQENKSLKKYYKPGSNECINCVTWSNILNTCTAPSCIGFTNLSKPKFSILNTKVKTEIKNANP